MISSASTGAGPSRLPVVAQMAILLSSLRGGQLPATPAQPLVQETVPVEIIDIFDDDEEIDWDLLQRESDEEEQASAEKLAALAAREEAGKKGEEAATVAPSVSSSSSDSSEAGYCISFRGGRPQMRCIRRSTRGPFRDP